MRIGGEIYGVVQFEAGTNLQRRFLAALEMTAESACISNEVKISV